MQLHCAAAARPLAVSGGRSSNCRYAGKNTSCVSTAHTLMLWCRLHMTAIEAYNQIENANLWGWLTSADTLAHLGLRVSRTATGLESGLSVPL